MTDDKPREWWLREWEMTQKPGQWLTSATRAEPNEEQIKLYGYFPVVEASALTLWKFRCASLTAELVCIYKFLELKSPEEAYKFWTEANRIKMEREASIENPTTPTIKVETP